MTTLDHDLQQEARHIDDLKRRAQRRLAECREQTNSLKAQGAEAAAAGDTKGAAAIERRAQKLKAMTRRYKDLIRELEQGGSDLAAEVLLARLQGPDVDLLVGEVDRNREILVGRATAVLKARDHHRALRQRWSELNDKLRTLRRERGLPAPKSALVDFRIAVTPSTYVQKPDGPTYRDVSDLLHHLGL